MPTYGVFNDEGCIERDFTTLAAAEATAQQFRDRDDQDLDNGDPHAEAKEMCPDTKSSPSSAATSAPADTRRHKPWTGQAGAGGIQAPPRARQTTTPEGDQ